MTLLWFCQLWTEKYNDKGSKVVRTNQWNMKFVIMFANQPDCFQFSPILNVYWRK
jgi:hypothetical protein